MVEIVSPGREDQDQTLKRARYEALGVPAYWIADPAVPSLTELRLSPQAGRYVERAAVTGQDKLVTDHPFHIELAPAALAWRG